MIAFTEKGDKALHASNLVLIEHPFELVASGQLKRTLQNRGITQCV